jgi:hypothetical protein
VITISALKAQTNARLRYGQSRRRVITMTIDEAICKEEALAYSFGERYKRLGEPVGDLPELEAEHKQYAGWLRELKKYRAIFKKVGKILADNGYTIDDLDTIFGKINEEVNADE